MGDTTRVWVTATGRPATIPTAWLDYPALMRPYAMQDPTPQTPPAVTPGAARVVTEPKRARHTDTTTEPPAAGDEKE